MPSCVVRYCKNYYTKVNKTQGISYHMFPTNEVQHQEWISIIRKQRSQLDWKPSRSSTICSDHFKKKDKYLSDKGRTLLKNNAIPVIKKCLNRSIQNSLTNVEVSQESPKKAALKKRVRKLLFEKNKLQKRHKTLVQQNKRLKKKIVSVVVKIEEIRNKDYIYLIY